MPEDRSKADKQAIGTTFMIAGAGLIVSLGFTVGWVFAPAGIALLVVGLVYYTMKEGEE